MWLSTITPQDLNYLPNIIASNAYQEWVLLDKLSNFIKMNFLNHICDLLNVFLPELDIDLRKLKINCLEIFSG